ncbi:MAG: hypothetical protein EAZ53_13715 [Bacteroidetes bacterium]|nr:MAG: hypothetical protein EAZ53_13715 [Bacteroidota bacterium]
MSKVNVEINSSDIPVWNKLPPVCQDLLTHNILHSFLNGELYPTGVQQLELAIELAENGIDKNLISKLTRLDAVVFEDFIPKK